MFATLLKYEWRATRKLLTILTLTALGLGAIGCLLMRFAVTNFAQMGTADTNPLLYFAVILTMFVLYGGLILLAVYELAVGVILLYRFYQHKFTDQGYLTFTLPVTTEQIFWSNAVNMLIWSLISLVAVIAVIGTVVSVGIASAGVETQIIIRETAHLYQELFATLPFGPGYILLAVVTVIVSSLFSLMLPLTCITVGAVVVKKYKLLVSVGIYYGASTLIGLVTSLFAIIPFFSMLSDGTDEQFMSRLQLGNHVQLIVNTLFLIGLTVGSYFLTIHLMKKKLNLN